MKFFLNLFKKKETHKHNLRRLFGKERFYAIYGCDDCGKCFLFDPTGVTEETKNLPNWQTQYPKENSDE